METIGIIKYKTADGLIFDEEQKAIEHEKELVKKYTDLILGTLTKEKATALQLLVDRNTLNKDGFGSMLNTEISKQVFAFLGYNTYQK